MRSIWILGVWALAAASCTVTPFEERGDLVLKGTIFEGWVAVTSSDEMSPSEIDGAAYQCTGAKATAATVEYRCILMFPDGEKYDGEAYEEKVTVVYRSGGELVNLVVQTSQPAEGAEEHFRFTVEGEVAKGIEAIKTATTPAKLSLK